MDTFIVGGTVIIKGHCQKEQNGRLADYDPVTSVVVNVYLPDGTIDIHDVAMTKMSVGHYEYHYQLAEKPAGIYTVLCICVDGSDKTPAKTTFEVVNV
jgi:hypothetical protein